jgi:sterol desaturase/sphingolipid hydroxylase (fatty acid hydroxylase superfamily)
MHKVHHSDIKIETDSNYTSLFSVWDRLFGTFRIVENPKDIVYGIKGLEDEQTIKKMLMTPFNNVETQ